MLTVKPQAPGMMPGMVPPIGGPMGGPGMARPPVGAMPRPPMQPPMGAMPRPPMQPPMGGPGPMPMGGGMPPMAPGMGGGMPQGVPQMPMAQPPANVNHALDPNKGAMGAMGPGGAHMPAGMTLAQANAPMQGGLPGLGNPGQMPQGFPGGMPGGWGAPYGGMQGPAPVLFPQTQPQATPAQQPAYNRFGPQRMTQANYQNRDINLNSRDFNPGW